MLRCGLPVSGATRRHFGCSPLKAVSATVNLRHVRSRADSRSEGLCRAGKVSGSAAEDSQRLAVALTAGATACSLLLSANPASAYPQQPSFHPAAPAGPIACQQQCVTPAPAALLEHSPAAAPDVLASTNLQDNTAPQHTQHPMQQQLANMQQQQIPLELQQLAQLDEPHWLLTVLGIVAINILGLQAVLKVLQASRDSSTPVTVLVCRMGLRVENKQDSKLHERLRFLRDLMGVEHAGFFTFEEAMQAICNPPRGCQLAYADLQAAPLGSKQAGYDLFKQKAVAEQVRAQREEEAKVVHGSKPEGPQHRNMLQRLLGAAETQDAELAQACLLVTLVVLAKGTVKLPAEPLRDQAAFTEAMKSLCGHLKVGQLLAVELLMTPDNPQDFLSEAELMSAYPFLTDLATGMRIDHPDWSAAPSPFASTDDYGRSQYVADAAAAAMAAVAADVAGAEGAASAAAAAAATAVRDEQVA